MLIEILEDTDVSFAAVTYLTFLVQSLVANVNDITVHCHVNQRDVCVFLSVCPDSNDMTFDV